MFFVLRFTLVVALLGLFVMPVSADELMAVKAGYYSLNPEGNVSVSGGGVSGDAADFDGDLAIDESDGFFAEAALQLGSFRLFAAYLPISFSGDSVLSGDIKFKGVTFVEGHRIQSDVDIDIYEAGLTWYLVNLDDLPLRIQIGPEVAIKYVDTRIELQDRTADFRESDSIGAPIPSMGARVRVGFADYLGVTGRVGTLKYNGNSFLDVDAQVELSPLPLVGIFAGYRYLDLDVNEGDVIVDARFSGPYAGAMVRF